MRLAVVTPPAEEPITLDEAKAHCRVEVADDDALISTLIGAARGVCESRLRQALVSQTVRLYLDSFPYGGGYYNRSIRQQGPSPFWLPANALPIALPRPPVASVVSVKFYDYAGVLQTVDSSVYLASLGTPARIQPVFGQIWPLCQPRVDAVEIDYVVGAADASGVPDSVKAAMKLLIGHWYENREAVALGTIATEVPAAVDWLLAATDHGQYA